MHALPQISRPPPMIDNVKCADPKSRRLVIVDDHPLFRHGLAQLINAESGLAVCGEAGSAAEALSVIREVQPELAIVDVGLKGTNGIELTKSIRAEFPNVYVLILSMHDESLYAVRALRAGARGYVMKQEALANVVTAVMEVFAGRTYLSPGMANQVISKFVGVDGTAEKDITDRLSDRELEILELIGKGNEVRTIAKSLHLSPKTVESHRAHIKEKLNFENARQVARFAVQWVGERAV